MSEYLHVEPGQWVVAKTDWTRAYDVRRADKVTAQQISTQRFGGHYAITHRANVVAVVADKDSADKILQSLDGCIGEYRRREQAAAKACDADVQRILAKGAEE